MERKRQEHTQKQRERGIEGGKDREREIERERAIAM